MDANALITKGTLHFISVLFCHIVDIIKEKICWHYYTAKMSSNCLHSFVLLNENNIYTDSCHNLYWTVVL